MRSHLMQWHRTSSQGFIAVVHDFKAILLPASKESHTLFIFRPSKACSTPTHCIVRPFQRHPPMRHLPGPLLLRYLRPVRSRSLNWASTCEQDASSSEPMAGAADVWESAVLRAR